MNKKNVGFMTVDTTTIKPTFFLWIPVGGINLVQYLILPKQIRHSNNRLDYIRISISL